VITGLRGVVLLDADDARYLSRALDQLINMVGKEPNPTLQSATAKLAKAVASASEKGADTLAGVREVGAEQDSAHTALYDLVDSGEAAKILGCSAANVRDLGRRGRLPRHRAGPGWVYPAASVVALAERRAAKRG
jgi:hypothetical protein